MRTYKPLIVAVFLATAGIIGGWTYIGKGGIPQEKGILGGPAPLVSTAQGAEVDNAAILKVQEIPFVTSDLGNSAQVSSPMELQADGVYLEGAFKDPGAPVGPAISRSGLISYTIQSGDTLSRVASYFGISVQTITSANPGLRANTIHVGEVLKILPTSGVIYESKGGDTLASISAVFGISEDKITQFNPSVKLGSLDPGTQIIIPGGTSVNLAASQGSKLPNFDDQFIMPTQGYNWGILHHYNAVDIANSCGTPVVASAEGLVVPDENTPDAIDGWNGGYGNFVLIEHAFGNNVETRYAHLEKVLVQPGDYVKQGQEIGLMGETGDATGCHVHFEVIGAKNPFAKS